MSLCKFELVQALCKSTIPDDKDPAPHIAAMTSTHKQLVDGGETVSDSLLALVLACSLPASFEQQKLALWTQGDKPTSAMVAIDGNATAAKASVKPAKSTSAQANTGQRSGGGKRQSWQGQQRQQQGRYSVLQGVEHRR
jgi:hypothetical protein